MSFNINQLSEGLTEGTYQPGRPTVSPEIEKLFDKAMWYFISDDGKSVAIENQPNKFDIYIDGKFSKTVDSTKQQIVDNLRPKEY